jgi:pilus assembly protein Flp/PilA
MYNTFLKLYVKIQFLANDEQGQDLVEYALLLTLISLALIAGISGLATMANNTFNHISSSLA